MNEESYQQFQNPVARIIETLADPYEKRGASLLGEPLFVSGRSFHEGPILVFQWKTSEGWPIEYISQNITDQFGYRPEDLTGGTIPFTSLIHPDDRERVLADAWGYTSTGIRHFEQEYRLLDAAGKTRWVRHITVAGNTSDCSGGRNYGYIFDITGQKRREAAVRENETRYRNILENANEGIWILDKNFNITYADDQITRILRYKPGEMSGKPLAFFCLEEDLPKLQNNIAERTRGERGCYEWRFLRKDGRVCWAWISAIPMFDDENCFSGSFCMLADITARKQVGDVQQALYQISGAAQMAKTLDELYSIIHAIISRLMPAENCYIALYHPESESLSFPYYVDEQDLNPGIRNFGRGLTEYVIRVGQPLLASPEVFSSLENKGEVDSIGAPSIDWLGAPLISAENKVIGVLVVQSYSGSVRYTEQDKNILAFVSLQVAMAIERKQAEEALLESEQRSRMLLEAIPDIICILDRNGVFRDYRPGDCHELAMPPSSLIGKTVRDMGMSETHVQTTLEMIKRIISSRQIHEYEYDLATPAGQRLWSARGIAINDEEVLFLMHDITEQKKAEAALHNSEMSYRGLFNSVAEAIYIQGPDGRFLDINEGAMKRYGRPREFFIGKTLSALAAPDRNDLSKLQWMLRQAFLGEAQQFEFWGQGAHGEIFPEEIRFYKGAYFDREVVIALAQDITERKRFEEVLITSRSEIATAYQDTLKGWAHALEMREQETAGHSQRVVDLTLQLAEKVGVGEDEMVHIQRGALLHDIGKMGIPDHILLKKGPLNQEEWIIMRRHPVHAYELLSQIEYLQPALAIPYCHHERWDGKGYPRGLKAEEIPLAARIFALADVWDALNSNRSYRPAWPEKAALDYLRMQSGKHFDPEITPIFLKEILNC